MKDNIQNKIEYRSPDLFSQPIEKVSVVSTTQDGLAPVPGQSVGLAHVEGNADALDSSQRFESKAHTCETLPSLESLGSLTDEKISDLWSDTVIAKRKAFILLGKIAHTVEKRCSRKQGDTLHSWFKERNQNTGTIARAKKTADFIESFVVRGSLSDERLNNLTVRVIEIAMKLSKALKYPVVERYCDLMTKHEDNAELFGLLEAEWQAYERENEKYTEDTEAEMPMVEVKMETISVGLADLDSFKETHKALAEDLEDFIRALEVGSRIMKEKGCDIKLVIEAPVLGNSTTSK